MIGYKPNQILSQAGVSISYVKNAQTFQGLAVCDACLEHKQDTFFKGKVLHGNRIVCELQRCYQCYFTKPLPRPEHKHMLERQLPLLKEGNRER